MFRVGQAAVSACGMAAAFPLVSSKVYAADVIEGSRKIRACDLPVYSQPPIPELELVPDEVSAFQEKVSTVRKAVFSYLDQMQAAEISGYTIKDTTTMIKGKWDTARATTEEVVTFLKEDPGALPKAGIITVAGLGGMVAAYKGGNFKKTVYATSGMLAAASVCYPNQAVDLTVRGFNSVKRQAKAIYDGDAYKKPAVRQAVEPKPTEKKKESSPEPEKKTDTQENPSKDVKKTVDKNSSSGAKVDKSKMDFGQSKKEDQDLYTTRTK